MTVTPMMAQYLEIKSHHRGALLFYRMGDFYEMFFDDAVAAAEALDIALTKRGKHNGNDIPMCGVPFHAAEGYLLTLIRKGFRVAICEQLESPAEAKKRGHKSIVNRDVVRLVTPGTLTEDSLLQPRQHNFLAAFADVRGDSALAWIDISTGEFRVMSLDNALLGPELARLAPSELVISDSKEAELRPIVEDFGIALTPLGRSVFDSVGGAARICNVFNVAALDGFGNFARAEVSAMGALIHYVDLTQKGKLPLLCPPKQDKQTKTVEIDAATRRGLELSGALSGGKNGSLLESIDKTITAAGARLLARRLASPSTVLETISRRSDAVEYCVKNTAFKNAAQSNLKRVPDMDRALSRLALDRGGPRDLAALRNGLAEAQMIGDSPPESLSELLAEIMADLVGHTEMLEMLDTQLVAEPPLLARDGGFIAAGYDPELDEVRQLRDEGRSFIAQFQQSYIELCSIPSLKIKHNKVLGYFIEVTATHADRMLSEPLSQTFIHRQTTANQVRFTTLELSSLEARILDAGSRALEIEKRLYESIRGLVIDRAAQISQTARALAQIDLTTALAHLAITENWVKPVLDNSRKFEIKGGRHPVVEQSLRKQLGDAFIANDCSLLADTGAAIWLLTGPNMAGKSTFLRQNAIIAILAQMGSYVPATKAHIGLVSQIFSRVGASDDLARGRSTFMVEMVETAAILNQADDRALIILDEIGRGTATYDGLSIAWATLEHLHDVNKSRALFATHYHEMTALAAKLDGVENATVAVKEWEGEVVFLHQVRQGAADRSYGVQVAQLAGLPPAVIARARVVLKALESGEREGGNAKSTLIDDLPLFSVGPTDAPIKATNSAALDLLEKIHPDELTPKDALGLIYKLKDAAKN